MAFIKPEMFHNDPKLQPAINRLKTALRDVIQHSVGETILDEQLRDLLRNVLQSIPDKRIL